MGAIETSLTQAIKQYACHCQCTRASKQTLLFINLLVGHFSPRLSTGCETSRLQSNIRNVVSPGGNQPTPKMDRCRDRREHGDLLDLIHLHTGGAPLRRAIDEVLAFLSLPPSGPPMAAVTPPPQVALPPHQWHPCGSLPAHPRHRPLPLPGPGISSQSPSIVAMTVSTACWRWPPPSPAIMALSRTCSAPGSTPNDPQQSTSA